MDTGTWVLMGIIALLVINRFLVRLPGWDQRRGLFWGVQLVNLAAACFMIVVGVPELTGISRTANWMVALLFMFHIVQNNSRLTQERRARLQAHSAQDEAERARILAALHAGQGELAPPAERPAAEPQREPTEP